MEKKNILYIDILKIIASIAVVAIHVCAIKWYSIDPISKSWQVLNIFDSICRWAVPTFIMASGVLLLNPDKKITIKEIYLKYIKKIVVLIVFWQIVYSFVVYINYEDVTKEMLIEKFFKSHYHLWYLYMLIGLYIVTPIIKNVIERCDDKIIEYFLVLWTFFQIVLPTILPIINIDKITAIFNRLQMPLVSGYIGYYVLGYYLNKKQYKKKSKTGIYVLAILSVISIIVGTSIIRVKGNTRFANEFLYEYFVIPVLGCAVGVFIFIKNMCNKLKVKEKTTLIIKKIAKLTLGVFLMHPMVIIIFQKLGIDLLKWNVLISVPLATLIVYSLSMILTVILSKIPVIGKYIV